MKKAFEEALEEALEGAVQKALEETLEEAVRRASNLEKNQWKFSLHTLVGETAVSTTEFAPERPGPFRPTV